MSKGKNENMYMFPTLWYSGKGKTMKRVNKWPLDLRVEVGKIRAQRTFGTAQPFLMIPRWRVYTIVHLSKCQVHPSVWTFRGNHRSMSAVLRKASSCRKQRLTQRLIKIPSINNWVARSSTPTPTMQGTGKFLEEGAERTWEPMDVRAESEHLCC